MKDDQPQSSPAPLMTIRPGTIIHDIFPQTTEVSTAEVAVHDRFLSGRVSRQFSFMLLVLVAVSLGIIVSLDSMQARQLHRETLVSSSGDGQLKRAAYARELETTCQGKTILAVVAHQDDDLLFMNPSLQTALRARDCVRVVYLTAGDHGEGRAYVEQRQKGLQAAYSLMLGQPDVPWSTKTVELPGHDSVVITRPEGTSQVALLFFDLPDGNVNGDGFPETKFQTLRKLALGKIQNLTSLDGRSTYTYEELIRVLAQVIAVYQPAKVFTLSPDKELSQYDHSDHTVVGIVTDRAVAKYARRQQTVLPITFYVGYATRQYTANLDEPTTAEKLSVFSAYAHHDSNICHVGGDGCHVQGTEYMPYISRQYMTQEQKE